MLVAHSLTHLLSVQPFASSAFDTTAEHFTKPL